MTTTTYRDIPGYDGYMAGSDGSIWSCWKCFGTARGWERTSQPQRQLRSQPVRSGHLKVTLYIAGRRLHRYVHALVMFAFKGPRPYPKAEVRHLDGMASNNTPDNLVWGTHRENADDRIAHGRVPKGCDNGKSKLTPPIVKAIVKRWLNGENVHTMVRDYKMSRPAIYGVLKGRVWGHVTGIQSSSKAIPRNLPLVRGTKN